MRSFRPFLVVLLLFAAPSTPALAQGGAPFSGVTVKNLLDTPNLKTLPLLSAAGGNLAKYCSKYASGSVGGQAVVTTQASFTFKAGFSAPRGPVTLRVVGRSTDTSSDSFWVWIDGVKQTKVLWVPAGTALAERILTFTLDTTGAHTLEFTLREKPGITLRSVELSRVAPTSKAAAMKAPLAKAHPRLFFDAAGLAAHKARLTHKTVQASYKLPALLTKKAPAYKAGARNGGAYRSLGVYAMGQLLKPDPKQLAALEGWLQTATTYGTVGVDLDAEYFLEGLALTYDWLYHQLSPALRIKVRDTIASVAREVYEASIKGKSGGGLSLQQNHFWYSNLALALGAAVLYGEVPEAADWLTWAWDRLERITISFSPDGSFHEGASYWDFSMPVLYIYVQLYEQLTGLKVPGGKGLTGQARFRFHHLYPGLSETAAMEDSHKGAGRPAARLFLWEARRYKDPVVQGLAKLLTSSPSTNHFHLLWLDEKVAADPAPLTKLALARQWDDVGLSISRSSWANDATFAALVARPLGGKSYADLCASLGIGGTGHNHPAQNHFMIYGRGEVLAGDPGYTYTKKTSNHNTVLVDGKGQLGDGEMWPKPNSGRARIAAFRHQGEVTITIGDAASAYPAALGLTGFERFLVQVGKDLVVVYDTLAASKAVTYSWLLHHWGNLTLGPGTQVATIKRNKAQLTVTPLLPTAVAAKTSTYRPNYIHATRDITPKEPDVGLLELRSSSVKTTEYLVAMQAGAAGTSPPVVTMIGSGSTSIRRLMVGSNTMVFFNPTAIPFLISLSSGVITKTTCRVLVATAAGKNWKLVGETAGCVLPTPADQPGSQLDGSVPPMDLMAPVDLKAPVDLSVPLDLAIPVDVGPPADVRLPVDRAAPAKDTMFLPLPDRPQGKRDRGPVHSDGAGSGSTLADRVGCSCRVGGGNPEWWLALVGLLFLLGRRPSSPAPRRPGTRGQRPEARD